MKTLRVYTKPGCQYCTQAKTYLKNQNIDFEEIDVASDTNAREWLISQGYKTLPVIMKDDEQLVAGGWNSLKTMRREEILERLQNVS